MTSTFLDIPKWKLYIRRPSSGPSNAQGSSGGSSGGGGGGSGSGGEQTPSKPDCYHCVLLNELYANTNQPEPSSPCLTPPSPLDSDANSSYNEDDEYYDEDGGGGGSGDPGDQEESKTPLNSGPSLVLPGVTIEDVDPVELSLPSSTTAATVAATGVDEFVEDELIEPLEGLPIVTLCPPEIDSPRRGSIGEEDEYGQGITVISLEVPILSGSKQNRSASVDSPYLLQVPKRTDIEVREGPPKARSKSVDIVLPTNPGGPYLIVPFRQQPTTTK